MKFSDIGLLESLTRAVSAEGYDEPTPIQQQAIPEVLSGRDLLGCAQTGTGKTAAFALPVLQRLAATRGPASRTRALVLAPTRELAAQIGERFDAYGRFIGIRNTIIFGGVSQARQVRALSARPEVVIATPGRLLDLCSQRLLRLDGIEILVLDEADRMLDMGFINDLRKIVAMVPKKRQTLMFSATMPAAIEELGRKFLVDPVRVAVAKNSAAAATVDQKLYLVPRPGKRALLERVLDDATMQRVLVFTRTKRGADRVSKDLGRARVVAAAIHGNKSQGQRERALEGFRQGSVRVLVATDIAARGIDVDGVTHVINYDLPEVAETYVHRIGRTGRAGCHGTALSFCDPEERALLRDIERLTRLKIPLAEERGERPAGAAPFFPEAPLREEASAVAGQRGPLPGSNRRDGARTPPPPPRGGNGARPRGRVRRYSSSAHSSR